MEIGKILYDRRKELGLTLEEVGNIVGVGKSTVRKWEQGMIQNIKRDKIEALSQALKMSPISLVIGEFVPEDVSFSSENQNTYSEATEKLIELVKKVKPEDYEIVRSFLERLID